ncbi:TetR family transcriptional regulator [Rhodococcus sp. Leaf7]|uniref:TetR/AcrR family transcriptional regulator C-terminal domain-containing protein n=1 Tax=unclassified Rhodococcus (in: high G+C Gram-positive bacteria) TaxID=192944 RepID=UPI0005ACDD58|nr:MULTISPECIES: TetR/AcrR family transcriptional regulator C-terminal domain-containing protein [unclassified Rhodococcus (in: high G+C Gram-positive bacteria)]KIQ19648.1 TetR family transcriptional regulator [Rhodococcus sp. MEB064]KQU06221.1 TetR family transcriptional regulator [Rhodococcus sp. Leaf7]KQU41737.1 TetR family transcriptional regulator [Rhodococcus sp. Leaf247]
MQLRKNDVVDGALVILDDYGLADLSMRRLAGSLGVAPGALYWHVANKQALLGAVSDRILGRLDRSVGAEQHPLDDVRARAHRLRDALLAHRDGAEVVASSLSARTVTHPVRSTFAADLIAAGLSTGDADHAADAVLYYVLGATTDEQSRLQMESAGAAPVPESAGTDQHLDTDATARFAFGLELFVDGIRRRVRTLNA